MTGAYVRGLEMLLRGWFEEAGRAEGDVQDTRALNNRGVAMMEMGEKERAHASFERADELTRAQSGKPIP